MALGSQVGSLNGNQRGSMASRALNRQIKRTSKAPTKVKPARKVFQYLNSKLLTENAAMKKKDKRIPVRRHNRPYVSADIAS